MRLRDRLLSTEHPEYAAAPVPLRSPEPGLSGAAVTLDRADIGLASPMAVEPNHLQAVVWADLTGQEAGILTREVAMTVPALARQRHLLCGVAARCPLRLIGPDGTRAPVQPEWLTGGTGYLSAFHRTLWSIDDLIFYPFTVWDVERDDDDTLLWAARLPSTRWRLEDDVLLVDDRPADESTTLVIPGPHEGILSFGAPALRRTLDNLAAAANAARNPSAYLELHYTGTEPLPAEKKREVVTDWAAARRGEYGGVAFTGTNMELIEHGTHESHLLIEGRNADAVDVSRLVSSPAAMADATSAGASLTYETTSGRNTQFLDYGALLYMDAFAARLSMDDVSPAGHRVAWDVTALLSLDPTDDTTTGQE